MTDYQVDLASSDQASRATMRFAIVASRWNPRITDALVQAAQSCLRKNGIWGERIDVIRVPGAWEIPVTLDALAASGKYDALIALGCIVRGETRHFEHVADGCAHAMMQVSLNYGLPVVNGVLAVEAFADAEARAGGSMGNKGEEAALVALEMVTLLAEFDEDDA